jgi:hypothetical protein
MTDNLNKSEISNTTIYTLKQYISISYKFHFEKPLHFKKVDLPYIIAHHYF